MSVEFAGHDTVGFPVAIRWGTAELLPPPPQSPSPETVVEVSSPNTTIPGTAEATNNDATWENNAVFPFWQRVL